MIIDTKLALEKANGNSELAKELFTMLINELEPLLQQIKSSYQSNSIQDLLDHAHRLHGSTAYCGVPDLKSTAQKLEASVKNQKNNDEILSNIENVDNSIKLLLKNAPDFLNNN